MTQKRSFVIGITGLPCSGKSLSARLLANGTVFGQTAVLVDADKLGHEALRLEWIKLELGGRFGSLVFGSNGEVDRRRVADIVFADPKELAWLESLIHPVINSLADGCLALAAGFAVYDASLLFAVGTDRRCDAVLLLCARAETRIERAAARGWDAAELSRRDKRIEPLFTDAVSVGEGGKVRVVRNDSSESDLIAALREALPEVPEIMKGNP